jgi:hypothetical protein
MHTYVLALFAICWALVIVGCKTKRGDQPAQANLASSNANIPICESLSSEPVEVMGMPEELVLSGTLVRDPTGAVNSMSCAS